MFVSFFVLAMLGIVEGIKVNVKHGPVKGRIIYVGEHKIYSFRNIPYAKPPVGNLRFQLPREPDSWLSEAYLNSTVKIRCPQFSFYEDSVVPGVIIGQEDCLFLDVYVRKHHGTKGVPLPVVVYFHGGHFSHGSKEDYGPDYLLRYEDVILVVPNYRLGILGFMSFQDATNFGIWDQNAALKWVSENIARFGGDSQRVTIAGHEAGAAAVGLHMLAPASHGYFQAAISDSGTALSSWLIDIDPSPGISYKVAKGLRCADTPHDEQCLKFAPLEEILQFQGKTKNAVFLPKVDAFAKKSLIPYPPKTLYQKNYQKEANYLIGFTENEAHFEVSREFPSVLKYQHLDKIIHHFLRPYLGNHQNFEIIAKAAKYHYLRGLMIPSFESIEPHITKMMTDFLYRSPVDEVVNLHRQNANTNIFVYESKFYVENNCGLENRRCYGNEFYIFNSSYHQSMVNLHPHIEKTIETTAKMWRNFITSGYPDPHQRWKPCKWEYNSHRAVVSDTIMYRTCHRSDDSEFWISLVSELSAATNETLEKMPADVQQAPDYSNTGVNSNTWGAAALAVLFGILCVAMMGLVIITKRRTLIMSILPVKHKDDTFVNN